MAESMRAPVEIYVDNLAAYTKGEPKGEWISLPQEEEELRETIGRILETDEELMISDISLRDDCEFLRDSIGEWDDVYDVNVVAALIGGDSHPAVEACLASSNVKSLEQVVNLIKQEDEISFYPYEFDGSDNLQLMNRLSSEEKLGYTIIEGNSELKALLENTSCGTSNLMNYIDVEAVGRDLQMSGTYDLTANGYLDASASMPDLSYYTMQDIKADLGWQPEKKVELAKKQDTRVQQKKADLSPTM